MNHAPFFENCINKTTYIVNETFYGLSLGPITDVDTSDTVVTIATLNERYFAFDNTTAELSLLPSKLLMSGNTRSNVTYQCEFVLTDSNTVNPKITTYILYFVVLMQANVSANTTFVATSEYNCTESV